MRPLTSHSSPAKVRQYDGPGQRDIGEARQAPAGATGSPQVTGNWSLDILKERYARGEITKAEYEEMCETFQR